MDSTRYTELKPDFQVEDGFEHIPPPRSWQDWGQSRIVLLTNFVLLVCSLTLLTFTLSLRQGSHPHCKADLFSGLLPESGSLDHYEVKIFEDSPTSIYRQRSDEGEAAWRRLVAVDPFSIDEQTLEKVGVPHNASQFPEELGGGYVANLAVIHQLHCLKTVWQYTYFDYYKDRNHLFHKPEATVHAHIDHCVNMLRQALMCSPDTSVIPFMWTPQQKLPFPDYSTPRTCRNFEEILQWGNDHAAIWPGEDGFDRPDWHVEMFP